MDTTSRSLRRMRQALGLLGVLALLSPVHAEPGFEGLALGMGAEPGTQALATADVDPAEVEVEPIGRGFEEGQELVTIDDRRLLPDTRLTLGASLGVFEYRLEARTVARAKSPSGVMRRQDGRWEAVDVAGEPESWVYLPPWVLFESHFRPNAVYDPHPQLTEVFIGGSTAPAPQASRFRDRSLPSIRDRDLAQMGRVRAVLWTDPAEAARRLPPLAQADALAQGVALVVEAMVAKGEPEAAVALLQEVPAEVRGGGAVGLIGPAADPQAVTALLAQVEGPEGQPLVEESGEVRMCLAQAYLRQGDQAAATAEARAGLALRPRWGPILPVCQELSARYLAAGDLGTAREFAIEPRSAEAYLMAVLRTRGEAEALAELDGYRETGPHIRYLYGSHLAALEAKLRWAAGAAD